jgi:hypothetical protein
MNEKSNTPVFNEGNAVSVEISCSIEGDIQDLFLIFSIDSGNSWFKAKMQKKNQAYSVILPNITIGVKILYLFKAIGRNGEVFVENNNGHYFSQIAGKKDADTIEKDLLEEDMLSDFAIESDQDMANSQSIKDPFISSQSDNLPELPPEFSSNSNPFLQGNENLIDTNHNQSNIEPSYENQQPSIDSDQTMILDESDQTKILDESRLMEETNNAIKNQTEENTIRIQLRPIIAYNPFPADFGDIEMETDPLSSFSEIIDEKMDFPPEKEHSFIQRPKMTNSSPCSNCGAKLHSNWHACPICGQKQK